MLLLFVMSVICFVAGLQLQKKKQRAALEGRFLLKPWPIKKISIQNLGTPFARTPLGPQKETEIHFLPNVHVKGGISDLETWILCTLAKQAKCIFEFGTCTGKTAYLLARNSPLDAKIFTLTLSHKGVYQGEKQDSRVAKEAALEESTFEEFYYSHTHEERKITQLFGDSKAFDETPFKDLCDLVFIDGSHAYSYVMSDTKKALKMVKKGGWIFWHDYWGPKRNGDVFRALNELAKTHDLHHIEKTSLVMMVSKS